eukprot:gene2871-21224_t
MPPASKPTPSAEDVLAAARSATASLGEFQAKVQSQADSNAVTLVSDNSAPSLLQNSAAVQARAARMDTAWSQVSSKPLVRVTKKHSTRHTCAYHKVLLPYTCGSSSEGRPTRDMPPPGEVLWCIVGGGGVDRDRGGPAEVSPLKEPARSTAAPAPTPKPTPPKKGALTLEERMAQAMSGLQDFKQTAADFNTRIDNISVAAGSSLEKKDKIEEQVKWFVELATDAELQEALVWATADHGHTVLMSAAWRNSVPTLRLLLKLGAAPSTKDHLGWKARDFTTKFGVRGMSEMARAKILDDLENAEQSEIAPVAASRIIKRRASKTNLKARARQSVRNVQTPKEKRENKKVGSTGSRLQPSSTSTPQPSKPKSRQREPKTPKGKGSTAAVAPLKTTAGAKSTRTAGAAGGRAAVPRRTGTNRTVLPGKSAGTRGSPATNTASTTKAEDRAAVSPVRSGSGDTVIGAAAAQQLNTFKKRASMTMPAKSKPANNSTSSMSWSRH